MHTPGVEPGISAWKTTKLTVTPSKLTKISRNYIYKCEYLKENVGL